MATDHDVHSLQQSLQTLALCTCFWLHYGTVDMMHHDESLTFEKGCYMNDTTRTPMLPDTAELQNKPRPSIYTHLTDIRINNTRARSMQTECARTSHWTIPTQRPPIDSRVKQPADARTPSLLPTHPPFIHSPARPFDHTHSPTHPPKHSLPKKSLYR